MNPRRFPGLGLVLVAPLAQTPDPNVVQAQGDVRSAGAETRARYGSFLPGVSASAGGGSRRWM